MGIGRNLSLFCSGGNIVSKGSGVRTDNNESTYGMPIEEAEKMFPNGCEDWGISLEAFIEEEDNK